MYVLAACRKGGAVTTGVAIADAIGIIHRKGSNLLAKNRGHIALTRDWARSLLGRMGFVKRKATAKISVEEIGKLKEQFLFDIKGVVRQYCLHLCTCNLLAIMQAPGQHV